METQASDIWQRIYLIRGRQVMLDSDLAELYGTKTKILNKAVKRNAEYFPEAYMFRLEEKEYASLRFHSGTLEKREISLDNKNMELDNSLRFHSGTLENFGTNSAESKEGKGQHSKYLPYVFTEQGVAMLSGVLESSRAKKVNMRILENFSQLRRKLLSLPDLEGRLDRFEARSDSQFKLVLEALQKLTATLDQSKMLSFNSQSGISGAEKKVLHFSESDQEIHAILAIVAQYFGVKVRALKTNSRIQQVVLPRQVAIFLIRKHTGAGLKHLGTVFGGRDHTTILHSCQKISERVEKDEKFRGVISTIENLLKANSKLHNPSN